MFQVSKIAGEHDGYAFRGSWVEWQFGSIKSKMWIYSQASDKALKKLKAGYQFKLETDSSSS